MADLILQLQAYDDTSWNFSLLNYFWNIRMSSWDQTYSTIFNGNSECSHRSIKQTWRRTTQPDQFIWLRQISIYCLSYIKLYLSPVLLFYRVLYRQSFNEIPCKHRMCTEGWQWVHPLKKLNHTKPYPVWCLKWCCKTEMSWATYITGSLSKYNANSSSNKFQHAGTVGQPQCSLLSVSFFLIPDVLHMV